MTLSRRIALTLSVKFGGVLLAFIASALLARYLGPSSRGMLAYLYVLSATTAQFGNIGLHSANIYFGARDPSRRRDLIGNTLWVTFPGGTLLALVAWVILAMTHQVQALPTLVALVLATVPLNLGVTLFSALLVAFDQIVAFNVLEFAQAVGVLARVGGVLWLAHGGVRAFLVVEWLTTASLLAIYIAIAIRHSGGMHLALDWTLLRSSLAYGIKAYVASLLSFLVIRSDVFLVQGFRGFQEVGYYTIATGIVNYILLIPSTVGLLLFSAVSSDDGTSSRRTQELFRVFWPLFALICVGSGLLARPIIHIVYGSAYLPGTQALAFLLPGAFALGLEMLLVNDLAGRGFPPAILWAWAIGLIANVLSNLWTVPHFGMVGAAVTSSVAYSLVCIAVVGYFVRTLKVRWQDLVLPRWADIRVLTVEVLGASSHSPAEMEPERG